MNIFDVTLLFLNFGRHPNMVHSKATVNLYDSSVDAERSNSLSGLVGQALGYDSNEPSSILDDDYLRQYRRVKSRPSAKYIGM
jgi:hypothetical protein